MRDVSASQACNKQYKTIFEHLNNLSQGIIDILKYGKLIYLLVKKKNCRNNVHLNKTGTS